MYDYLVVGAGFFGAVFAREMTDNRKKCLVIDRRSHIGGNCYTENINGINVHKYGAHVFHTSDAGVWEYVNRYAEFNNFINTPMAIYGEEIYNLPFNMNTFSKMWGIKTPAEARNKIAQQIAELNITNPKNLEEQALSLVGRDVYQKLVKEYTEKQWGRKCQDLPPFIIKRLPLRFTYDNNYFNDRYQGIPVGGYTLLFEKLLCGIDVRLNVDYKNIKNEQLARKIIFCGCIDEFFDYCYGELEYRSLKYETEFLDCYNYQGNAVINYTSVAVPYTRIIEHKHFEYGTQQSTIISREYPVEWHKGMEPYYPINNTANTLLYNKYSALAAMYPHIIFGGRLGQYKYYDMDQTIRAALNLAKQEIT